MVNEREPRLSFQALRILGVLLEAPREGFAGADIRKLTGIAPGTLYPVLMRLERAGWFESSWEEIEPHEAGRPRRRLYRITDLGVCKARKALQQLHPKNSTGTLVWT